MERKWLHYLAFIVIVVFILRSFAFVNEGSFVDVYDDLDGKGVVSSNTCDQMGCKCCRYVMFSEQFCPGALVNDFMGQRYANVNLINQNGVEGCRSCGGSSQAITSSIEENCVLALISLLSAMCFGGTVFDEDDEFSEKKAVGYTVDVTSVLVILVCLALCYESLLTRIYLRNKIWVKLGDQEEWAAPEALPLPLESLVHLKKIAAVQGDPVYTAKLKKHDFCMLGGADRHDFSHYFEFRRDGVLEQTITACPVTTTFASYFVSGSYGQPSAVQELNKEGVRLATFRDFPPTVPVSALRLAQAGFYYLGERDLVKCFLCGMTHQGWQVGDKPAEVHARVSPNCALVRATDSSNQPLPLPITNLPVFPSMDSAYGSVPQDSASLGEPASAGSVQVTTDSDSGATSQQLAISGSTYVPDSMRTQQPSSSSSSLGATSQMSAAQTSSSPAAGDSLPSTLGDSAVFSGAALQGPGSLTDGSAPRSLSLPTRRLDLMGAVYPLYSQLDARKRSFATWTARPGLPSVHELVTLGFFYAGYADCVRCFFCGIGLKSWEAEDVPAEVHARWRSTCDYLRLVKGDVFVDTVVNGGDVASLEPRNQNIGGANQSTDGPQSAGTSNPQSQSQQSTVAVGSGGQRQRSTPSVPDIPVVQQARQNGYTDQQIAEAIEKLRLIGMEGSIDGMLIEILTNLFHSDTSQRDGSGTGTAGQSGSNAAPSSRDNDMQQDAPAPDAVADNPPAAVVDERALQERQVALQEENARLRDMRVCQQCRERPVGVIFLPCGHIVACAECAPSMRRCTRCNNVIRATANVFFS